jgi:hypothetical protein
MRFKIVQRLRDSRPQVHSRNMLEDPAQRQRLLQPGKHRDDDTVMVTPEYRRVGYLQGK